MHSDVQPVDEVFHLFGCLEKIRLSLDFVLAKPKNFVLVLVSFDSNLVLKTHCNDKVLFDEQL